ncbi:MAG: DEAD/DEAH box helicase family protein [Candidatus Cloacimonetes bacterium]|nr:DEAD/DEAH box helicase family protein [Candidatus Cloacimonadota bacterium]
MSGFFTSSSLAIAARGIVNLINNNGKMRILTCPILSREDAEIISQCSDDPDGLSEKLSKIMLNIMDEDFMSDDATEALGWMLLNGHLEIRIVLVKGENEYLNSEQVNSSGIFHNKVGIFKDDNDNVVTFSGSINESFGGWVKNIESFEVFCSWDIGSDKHIVPHINRFQQYWEFGHMGRSQTIPFPDAVRNAWIKFIPTNKEDLKIFKKHSTGIRLRKYQNDAIELWAQNNFRGIYNMATGTGKTITAIFAVKELISTLNSNYVLVIAVPNQHLILDPWVKSLEKYLFTKESENRIIQAFSGNNKWANELSGAKMDYRLNMLKSICIVTTYDTLSSDRFIVALKTITGKKILVADEVHNAGADTFRLGLLEVYDYRLGLSATPARYLDDDGTQFITSYFGKEIFTFTLDEAITQINPDTNKTYLTPYIYHPIFVSLNEDELEQYNQYSENIAKSLNIDEPTPQQLRYREMMLIKRARIGKNAAGKIDRMYTLVPELKEQGFFDHCLIYCSDGRDSEDNAIKSLNRIIDILNKNSIHSRRFTSEDAFSSRPEILNNFANGNVSTLVAIKCLDEGVDVPATRNAIIMASTGNPREYIQRRGRILRPSPGKDFATLYDFMIIPGGSEKYRGAEHQLFNTEYRRFKEFSYASLNKDENEAIIGEVISKHGIRLEEIE